MNARTIARLKKEIDRLEAASQPEHVKKFIRRMRERYPELLSKEECDVETNA